VRARAGAEQEQVQEQEWVQETWQDIHFIKHSLAIHQQIVDEIVTN